jgi:hypothetical protein
VFAIGAISSTDDHAARVAPEGRARARCRAERTMLLLDGPIWVEEQYREEMRWELRQFEGLGVTTVHLTRQRDHAGRSGSC